MSKEIECQNLFSGNMYAGNGDVACDQYHKYKVSDPIENQKKLWYRYMHAHKMHLTYTPLALNSCLFRANIRPWFPAGRCPAHG